MTSDPSLVVQAQVDAYNAHDLESFVSCYSEDITIHYLSGHVPAVQGRDALKTAYAFLVEAPKEFGVEIVNRMISGRLVIDIERVLGLPQDASVPDMVAIYEVRDERIQNVWFAPQD